MQAIVKRLARGGPPPARPLFMPLFFGAAARLSGLSPQQFYSNPTKIANGLRQLQAPLGCDGLACYTDRTLIPEALGAAVRWEASGPRVTAPPRELAPGEIGARGRVPVMLEVLRRLRTVLRDRVALSVALSGVLATAEAIRPATVTSAGPDPADVLALAGGAVLQAARLACEAGADLVLLVEEALPVAGHPASTQWSGLVDTIANLTRFFEALTVVMPLQPPNDSEPAPAAALLAWPAAGLRQLRSAGQPTTTPYGLAVPATAEVARLGLADLRGLLDENCVLVTTAGDLADQIDAKDLGAYVAAVRQILPTA